MSFFRNFNKTLHAQRFTRPNNILLSASYRPTLACTLNEPSIDYLNTLKDFNQTYKKIQSFDQNGSFKSIIQIELNFLNRTANNYKVYAKRFAESGADLTAQGIANLYSCAQDLGLTTQWFNKFIYDQIPHHIRHMNVQNLKDLSAGLQKYHSGSQYQNLVKQELDKKNGEPVQYVDFVGIEISQFEQTEPIKSNNILIRNYESGSPIRYYADKTIQAYWDLIFNLFHKKPYGYILHNSL